jgi:enoyl-CoA hydratase
MDLCLTGRNMDAEEAEKMGLVARIYPHEELLEKALEVAATIAGMPRVAALVNKEMVDAAFETTLEQGLLFERRMWQIVAATEDKAEGMAAFVEKRPANWKNR